LADTLNTRHDAFEKFGFTISPLSFFSRFISKTDLRPSLPCVCVCVCVYVCMYLFIYLFTYVYVCMYVCMYVCNVM
jgi:hypothetical protein